MNILKAVNLRKIYGQGETEVRALDETIQNRYIPDMWILAG